MNSLWLWSEAPCKLDFLVIVMKTQKKMGTSGIVH